MNHERLSHIHELGRPQSWEALDADLRAKIKQAVERITEELSPFGFVGAYLHGSLSTGSFYRPKSDVDILFVVEEEMSPHAREQVARSFCDLSDGLPLTGDYEVSVLRRSATQNFHHPLPYEMHYSHSHKEQIEEGTADFAATRTDPDLAVHCTAVRKRGIPIDGAPIKEVFGPVPAEDYRASIVEDLSWILEDDHLLESPFYGVLNCCRVLDLETEGWDRVLSKDEGGEWALQHVPAEQRAIIAQALACYRSSEPVPVSERRTDGHSWDVEALSAWGSYVTELTAKDHVRSHREVR
jgi:predicted nucleotidyltransferase